MEVKINTKELKKSIEKIKQEFGCDPAYYGLNEDFEVLEYTANKLEELDEMLTFNNGAVVSGFWYNGKQLMAMPLEEYDDMQKDLNRLDLIEQTTNKDKALRQLSIIKHLEIGFDKDGNAITVGNAGNGVKDIETALIRSSYKDSICKEKEVDFYWLNHCETAEGYNAVICSGDMCQDRKLTNEEFDILKK